MKNVSLMRSVIACCLMTISAASCTTVNQRLEIAATEKGRAGAGVKLPALDADCRKLEAHADLIIGSEVRSVLIRERAALDRANGRVTRCAEFYDTVKSRLEKK